MSVFDEIQQQVRAHSENPTIVAQFQVEALCDIGRLLEQDPVAERAEWVQEGVKSALAALEPVVRGALEDRERWDARCHQHCLSIFAIEALLTDAGSEVEDEKPS